MANPHSKPSPAEHRFTRANAAEMGRRGAAERERRFLARWQRLEDADRQAMSDHASSHARPKIAG